MTLNYGIFDVSDPQNPDRVYSAALLSRILSKHIRDGIVHGDGDEMAVTVTDPPAMTVQVGTGTAMVQGRFCENDAALTLSVPAAHATYPRIDRVVVRLNASPGRTIDILVKKGTPAPSPVPPALTRTPEIWELSLAQVRVEAGATLILSEKITDERGNTSLCGVAAPVYVPSSQVEVVGAVDMQGSTLTGLPAPSGATDAARKGYVDTEIAGAIGGFGISQIAIDADKDWRGNDITNVGTLSVDSLITTGRIYADNLYYRRITPTASDTPVVSRTGARPGGRSSNWRVTDTITIPPGYNAGSVRVSCWVVWSHHIPYRTRAQILNNGDVVAEISRDELSVHEYLTADISISPGDVITIRGSTNHPNNDMLIEDVQVGATLTYEGIDTAHSTTISIA